MQWNGKEWDKEWVRKSKWWKWRILYVPDEFWPAAPFKELEDKFPGRGWFGILDLLMMAGVYESRLEARKAIRADAIREADDVPLRVETGGVGVLPGTLLKIGSYRVKIVKGKEAQLTN